MNIQTPNLWLEVWLEPYEAKASSTVLRGEENGDIPPSTRLLSQLIKNSERLAVVEKDLKQIKDDFAEAKPKIAKIDSIDSSLGWIKWILLNEGRRQEAGGRRISCRGILTRQQLLTAKSNGHHTLPRKPRKT